MTLHCLCFIVTHLSSFLSLSLFLYLARRSQSCLFPPHSSNIMYPGNVKQAYDRHRLPKSFSVTLFHEHFLFLYSAPHPRGTPRKRSERKSPVNRRRHARPRSLSSCLPHLYIPPGHYHRFVVATTLPLDRIPLSSRLFSSRSKQKCPWSPGDHDLSPVPYSQRCQHLLCFDVFRSLIHSFHVSFSKRAFQDCTPATRVFASPRRE